MLPTSQGFFPSCSLARQQRHGHGDGARARNPRPRRLRTAAAQNNMPRKDRSEPTGSRKGPANKEPAAEGDEQQVCYLDNFLQGAWRGAKKQKPID